MEDSSLSQGIFIQKPKNKKNNAHRRIDDEIIKVYGKPSETATSRREAYKQHWQFVQDKVEELEKQWHENIVNEITAFIKENSKSMFESELVTPIGFLQTGLSADENMQLFETIINKIESSATPYVARLRSTMCPNVKTAFQNICRQLMQNNSDVSRVWNETGVSTLDESFSSLPDGEPSANRYLSMHDLQQWYESKQTSGRHYYKSQLMMNSPAVPGSPDVLPKVLLTRMKITEFSPSTPNRRSSYRSRKSLFGTLTENENVENPAPVPEKRAKRSSKDEKYFKDITEKEMGFTTPKKEGERVLRSSSSKKPAAADSPKESTPTLCEIRGSRLRKCLYDGSSPEGKINMPSPIPQRLRDCTPKRGSMSLKNTDVFHTPTRKKVQTPLRSCLTPKFNGTDTPPPIVLIIDDVDYFPSNVIQQIFQLLSCAKLPVILVVGVINCYENFSRFVPQQCSTTLMYKAFSTVTASKRLNDFFDSVMYMADYPLILSGRIVDYLSDYFLLHHFSATRLMQAYNLCLLDYYASPKSLLCTGAHNIEKVLDDVDPKVLLTTIRATSMDSKLFVDAMKPRTPTKRGKVRPSADIKTEVSNHVIELHGSCVDWFASVMFLSCMCMELPGFPLGKSMRELYIICFNGNLIEEDDSGLTCIERVLQLMEFLHQKEIEARLRTAKEKIEDFKEERGIKEAFIVDDILFNIDRFLKQLDRVKEEERKLAEDVENEKGVVIKIKKAKSAWELQQTLKSKIDKKSGISVFVNVRKSIIDYVRKFVKTNLQSLSKKRNSDQHFSPLPHERIHKALLSPGRYLKCKCCSELFSDSVVPSLPDTSIVYKLYLEKTFKTVDLNELYETFRSVVEEESPKRRGVKKQASQYEKYILRFRQAVAELQHMGFMLRCKRKADEVTRQAW